MSSKPGSKETFQPSLGDPGELMNHNYLYISTLILALGCSSSEKSAPGAGTGTAGHSSPQANAKLDIASSGANADPQPVDSDGQFELNTLSSSLKSSKSGSKEKGKKAPSTNELTKPSESSDTRRSLAQRTLYLSADDSNSQASAVIVRNRIAQGRYVDPTMVRTYEFLNYYTFLYPPAEKNSVAIYPELRRSEKTGEYSMQVAVRSEDRARRAVLPLNFTLLLDVSGSMAGQPMALMRKFVGTFLNVMKTGDRLSVVTCNRHSKIIVDSFIYNKKKLNALANKISQSMTANDITDLHSGIELAYKLAEKNYNEEFLNRVLLLSDGASNAGTLALQSISKHSRDSERRGIYMVGVGFGEGFNDSLMDAVTDAGKGAYFFVNSSLDIEKALVRDFAANFDIAVKDVRLKMVMPDGWSMVKFHGEQVSSIKSDVIPQHLAPNDQMIYHQVMKASLENQRDQEFTFEAEFREAESGKKHTVQCKARVKDMLKSPGRQVAKGDAICAYAEMLKKIKAPLELNRRENLGVFDKAFGEFKKAKAQRSDSELDEIETILDSYRALLDKGESFPGSHDKNSAGIADVLGLDKELVKSVKVSGANTAQAIKAFKRLNSSTQLTPREGYRFLMLSTGPAGATRTKGVGKLSGATFKDPAPAFMGLRPLNRVGTPRIHDVHQITLTLRAPRWAKSFSFDFNFFSAEYPEYVKKNYNDTFYAIIKADSTNNGKGTNIAFDSQGQSIEVDNNYFQNPYHPISNRGTGFGNGGSTSWLRTSWPIRGGETFTLTFSVHDEGDEVYDSAVLLDHFQWHRYGCVGNTDPLN
jgi:Ca-activated chloride channel homolog